MDYLETYKLWANDIYFDEKTRNELLNLKDEEEIQDRFYKELEFGTGGLRGIVDAGINRMNIYTVRKASQGVADYVNSAKEDSETQRIAIAYDSRRMSKEFASEAACVFAANGIKAFLFKELMPTPVLSFAVRKLKCAAGVVVTASHNPKEYNGYKVYGPDGGQITDKTAKEISDYIRKVNPIRSVKTADFEDALSNGLIEYIGNDVLDEYIKNVLNLSTNLPEQANKSLRIVYTPLHGTGLKPVTKALKNAGFSDFHVVEKQAIPDTEFSTVKTPNPEDHAALELAINLAGEISADIVIASDPDCDRLGVAIRDGQGSYNYLSGNQMGCILLDYILKAKETINKNDYMIKTIVSTKMSEAISKHYGIKTINVLTGFKYIGEKIKELENSLNFVFGFEESYGYLAGTFVRDKDAVIAALLTCEAAAFYKLQGKTLLDALNQLFEKYGYYLELTKNYTFLGIDGGKKITAIMNGLREMTSPEICGRNILNKYDFQEEQQNGYYGLPKSNVLLYDLDNDAWLAVRPSGTEPKLKLYIGVKGKMQKDSEEQAKAVSEEADRLVRSLIS